MRDGTLFGERVKTRMEKQVLTECNCTPSRDANGVFARNSGIKTNLLVFTKGRSTKARTPAAGTARVQRQGIGI